MGPDLPFALELADAADAVSLPRFGARDLLVETKPDLTPVTEVDRAVEREVRRLVAERGAGEGVLGEELGEDSVPGEARWIVDPIDGTTNFIHGMPLFAISIALQRRDEIVAGLIYNPIMNELFTAERGRGAQLNERRRLRVTARRDLKDALIGCGLPHDTTDAFARFNRELAAFQGQVAGLRRTGSACLDLAYVAAGRLDAFWERGLKPWDLAAGILIIREAGGRVVDIEGGDPMASGNVIASNAELLAEMQKKLASA